MNPPKRILLWILQRNPSAFYAIDLKVDYLAVPIGNSSMDKELEQSSSANYRLNIKLTNRAMNKLAERGFLYCYALFIPWNAARKLWIWYDKGESAYASLLSARSTSTENHSRKRRFIKFYFRISQWERYFGTKWDADISWQDRLRNQFLFQDRIKKLLRFFFFPEWSVREQ